jgi:hypothetical protein
MQKSVNHKSKNLASSLPAFSQALRPARRGVLTHERLYQSHKVTLIEALDRVIDSGAYIDGEVVLSVADIDLIYIGLRVLVTSISKAERLKGDARMGKDPNPTAEDLARMRKLEERLKSIEDNIPKIIDAGTPEKAERGIAKLVLTLVELIRQLLEREAMRRVDAGTLSDMEVQKLGLTFKTLERKIQELKAIFGIKEELNLELGPLGNLL